MARLAELYNKEMVAQLMKDQNYSNVMEVPRLVKIVLNMGLGEAIQNVKADTAGATTGTTNLGALLRAKMDNKTTE